jgi:hypothetical protein
VIFRIRQKVPVQAGAGKIPGEEPDPGYQCPGTDHFYFHERIINLNRVTDPDPVSKSPPGYGSVVLNYGSAEISNKDSRKFQKSLIF